MDHRTKQLARTEQFKKFKAYAERHGGTLMSTEYVNSESKLQFQCGAGHTFTSCPGNMWHKKSWCRVCAASANRELQLSGRDFLAELQEIARQRGGACHSSAYLRSSSKLDFACADGHEWKATPNDIRRGTWCPSCGNKTEGLVRRYLECRFGATMPSRRLPWLIDAAGKQRILDGYSETLQLAFEYHGVQHFEHVTFFHTQKSLEQQQTRDAFVRDACAAAGVLLLEIPPLQDGYTQEEFVSHLETLLDTQSDLPPAIPGGVAQFLAMPERISKLTELQEMARARGGRCLATKFLAMNSKVTWECATGHTWEAVPKTIKSGHWCPYCSNCRRESPMEDLHKLAAANGGRCLSKTYTTCVAPMEFVCKKGHEFTCTAASVWGQKSWCQVCSGNRIHRPLERLQKVAESKGGVLLSTEYVNSKTKVELRCADGHTWRATPLAIVHHDTWCKQCACRANGSKGGRGRQPSNRALPPAMMLGALRKVGRPPTRPLSSYF